MTESQDLWLAGLGLAALSLVAFALGWDIARRTRRWMILPFLSVMLLTLWDVFKLHGTLAVSRLLPLSAVIIWGNWIPVATSLLAGLAWGDGAARRRRRLNTAVILVSLGWGTLLADLVGQPPTLGEPWYSSGFLLQTHAGSCSACCGAALLYEHGIEANEQEMARLCLTRPRGTRPLGLYRGLKLKCEGTPWEVATFRGDPATLADPALWPVVLAVCPEDAETSPLALAPIWRVDHAVVLYRLHADGSAEIGDPAIGRLHWSAENLRQRWTGEAVHLVRRSDLR